MTQPPWEKHHELKFMTFEERAQKKVDEMTLDEKLAILSGDVQSAESDYYMEYSEQSKGVPRLGIPTINFNEGTYGFATADHPRTSTAFPSGLSIAATWDPE